MLATLGPIMSNTPSLRGQVCQHYDSLNKRLFHCTTNSPFFNQLSIIKKSATLKRLYVLQYLVRTPVPHGGDGHADDDPGPRQVRVHRVSEYVEGVISRDATG